MVKQKVNLDFENSSRIVNHPSALVAGDIVIKQDLDNAIAELSGVALKAPQDIDCSSDPDYPACDAGQSFYVTVAGRIGGAGGVVVNIGDTIFCKAPGGSAGGDQATVGNEFFIAESNRDQATELELGVAALASQTEVNNGTVANKIVTPLTLQTKLNNAFNSRKYATAIGDGTNTTFTSTICLLASVSEPLFSNLCRLGANWCVPVSRLLWRYISLVERVWAFYAAVFAFTASFKVFLTKSCQSSNCFSSLSKDSGILTLK